MLSDKLAKILNLLAVLAIICIQGAALTIQFTKGQLPCPLCLLQRAGLWGIAFGFLLNLRYGIRARHYGFALLAATLTAAIAMRQVLLHIVPGSGNYGIPIFGLSLYTWCFLAASAYIIAIAILLLFQNTDQRKNEINRPWFNTIATILFVLVMVGVFMDAGASFMECGFYPCPDNPVKYRYL